MTPRSLLLCVLALLCLLSKLWCSPTCNNRCCRFVENFPVRLRKLRESYSHIRDFYEANDDIDHVLLDQTVEDTFNTPFACQAMKSILEFYLRTVFPAALADSSEDTRDLKPHMESIQQILDELKREVNTCRHFFSCKNQFDMTSLNSTYTQMQSRGLFKAMTEMDLLFNFIETYLASKQHRS